MFPDDFVISSDAREQFKLCLDFMVKIEATGEKFLIKKSVKNSNGKYSIDSNNDVEEQTIPHVCEPGVIFDQTHIVTHCNNIFGCINIGRQFKVIYKQNEVSSLIK